jgi:HB1, ASXL, restriction endonuclease HTH domain
MTYLQAALAVLKVARRPLTVEEIVVRAVEGGLLQPAGKTPVATMSSKLYRYVRDNPDALIERHASPGRIRAQRGSVRWSLRGRRHA